MLRKMGRARSPLLSGVIFTAQKESFESSDLMQDRSPESGSDTKCMCNSGICLEPRSIHPLCRGATGTARQRDRHARIAHKLF